MKKGVLLALVAGALCVAAAAGAANVFTTFGDATVNGDGSVTITSSTAGKGYGGISLPVAPGTTLAGVHSLSTDYRLTAGDCAGGSPRYAISLSGGGTVNVYFGPAPSFTGCGTASQSTGDVAAGSDLRVDTSQIGGTFYDTWSHAVALAGSQTITELAIVVDSDWVAGNDPQSVTLWNVQLNGTTYVAAVGPPTSKDQCKDGGWATFNSPAFTNQGDCVSYVVTGGRN